jgi:predicted RecA/RadA family phage recombinase
MRKFIVAACSSALGITLSISYAALASASSAVSPHGISSGTIVVGPGESIQAAVNKANPGDTVLVKPGVYHQSVQIRTDGITLRGSGNSQDGTVLMPPAKKPHTLCTKLFGATGVCILAKKVNAQTGAVLKAVSNDTVAGMYITGFPASGVFGYGTSGLKVVKVSAVNDGAYGIARFESTRTLFAHDTAVGNDEAGLYVGDSPHADTVVRDNVAIGNQFGVFIRHARGIAVRHNLATKNCQGILVLDDGQRGGAGNAVIAKNVVVRNNKFCPKSEDAPALKGGGILLLGATHTVAARNAVAGNKGKQFNSGGIVVLSAKQLTHGRNPDHDTIAANHAFHNRPADLIWDGTGVGVHFVANHCGTSRPSGLCH